MSLAQTVAEHGEAIEADLARYYDVDILDVGRPPLTWRRLRAYLEALRWTRESAFWRDLDPEGEGWWTVGEYQLANVIDLLAHANWQRSEDGSKGRNRPKPVERPGDAKAKRDKASLIEASIKERERRRAIRDARQQQQQAEVRPGGG